MLKLSRSPTERREIVAGGRWGYLAYARCYFPSAVDGKTYHLYTVSRPYPGHAIFVRNACMSK